MIVDDIAQEERCWAAFRKAGGPIAVYLLHEFHLPPILYRDQSDTPNLDEVLIAHFGSFAVLGRLSKKWTLDDQLGERFYVWLHFSAGYQIGVSNSSFVAFERARLRARRSEIRRGQRSISPFPAVVPQDHQSRGRGQSHRGCCYVRGKAAQGSIGGS